MDWILLSPFEAVLETRSGSSKSGLMNRLRAYMPVMENTHSRQPDSVTKNTGADNIGAENNCLADTGIEKQLPSPLDTAADIPDHPLSSQNTDFCRDNTCIRAETQNRDGKKADVKPSGRRESVYRLVNGYKVREVFSGGDSLTSLLTRYMERTVALNY